MFDLKKKFPLVSAIVLCRNEERFIKKCLDSLLATDYPKDRIEILVIDGMSEDKTRDIVSTYAKENTFITLIDNPKKLTPFAFNAGIKSAQGELVMILSAHATYRQDYIRNCVNASQKYDADNVVGIWKILPRKEIFSHRAVVLAMSSPFGVGNAKYRTVKNERTEVEDVDTGAYGCFKKRVFEKIGLFNEELSRGQDMEFNLRLKKAGGHTILIPNAIVYYYTRSDIMSFLKHNFKNGKWAIIPFKYTDIIPVSIRHLVPLAFVTSLMIFGIFPLFSILSIWPFIIILAAYFLSNLFFSVKLSLKNNFKYIFLLPLLFTSLHVSYGLGSLLGVIIVIFSKNFWKNKFHRV